MLGIEEGFFPFLRVIVISHFERSSKCHQHYVLMCICVCPEYWAWGDPTIKSWNYLMVYTIVAFHNWIFFSTMILSIKWLFSRKHLKHFCYGYRSPKVFDHSKPTSVYVLEIIHELEIYTHSGSQTTKIKNHLSLGIWAYKQDFQQSLGAGTVCNTYSKTQDSTGLICSVTWFKELYQLPPKPTLPRVS